MTAFLQLAATVALGLAVSWLAGQWFGLFENSNVAFFLGAGCLLFIGWMVDRRTARRRRERQD